MEELEVNINGMPAPGVVGMSVDAEKGCLVFKLADGTTREVYIEEKK